MAMLFSYGTLQQSEVQAANFGRELVGLADALTGYVLGTLKSHDARVIREGSNNIRLISRYTGEASDTIAGTVFELGAKESAQANSYEFKDYTISDNLLHKLSRKNGYAVCQRQVETASNPDENGIKAERLYGVCCRDWYYQRIEAMLQSDTCCWIYAARESARETRT